MNNLIICFPAGGGGHLVGAMCSFLLYGNKFQVKDNGSVHDFQCVRYLDGVTLDYTAESVVQEYADISRLPDFDIALAHFRNLAQLQSLGKKIVYIDFNEDDAEIISSRLVVKMSTLLNQKTYDLLKGTDWPEYNELSDGTLDDLKELRTDFIKNWFYSIPVRKNNIFKISFSELESGTWVNELSKFLGVVDYDERFVSEILDEYRRKQL